MPRTTKNKKPANKAVSQKVSKKITQYLEKNDINDPRKELFLRCYFDPASPTFSNAYQSALEAGFGKRYATQIIAKNGHKWIQDFRAVFREKIFNKAETRLWDLMHSNSDKVAADMTKFALSTLGKDTYSTKSIEDHRHLHMHQLDPEQVQRILETMK